MRYMLDTDMCIYAINERPARVLQALREHEAAGLGNNTRGFVRLPGLRLENWAEP